MPGKRIVRCGLCGREETADTITDHLKQTHGYEADPNQIGYLKRRAPSAD